MHLSVALCKTRINHRAWSMEHGEHTGQQPEKVRYSDRLVSFRTILQGCKTPNIISVYVPTFMADPTREQAF